MRLIDAGLREGHAYTVREDWLTLPNLITLARFALVPVFVWLTTTERYLAACGVLAVLSCTDWVDGYVARRFDMMSTVGAWLDPAADRLALMVVAVTFVATGITPLWFPLAVILPDLLLAALSAWLFRGSPELKVTVLGKVRTALLLVGTPALLLVRAPELDAAAWTGPALALLLLGSALHVLAAVDYARRALAKATALRSVGVDPRDRDAWAG